MLYGPLGKCDDLKQDIVNAAIDETFLQDYRLLTSEHAFLDCMAKNRTTLVEQINKLGSSVYESLDTRQAIVKKIKAVRSIALFNAVKDLQQQLDLLIYPAYVRHTPVEWLKQMPRYLKAIERRLEKLEHGGMEKDRAAMLSMASLWAYCLSVLNHQNLDDLSDEFISFRWLMEELRVSLYAQELKTLQPVSVSRLEKLKQQLSI